MPEYSLEYIEEIPGRRKLFRLLINSNWEFENFENSIEEEGQYESELVSIQVYLHMYADITQNVSPSKVHTITAQNDPVTEIEFRSRHLRVYAFKVHGGFAIVCGGHKNTQAQDIAHFRSIKQRFLNS